jgi:8-oxo-dGTP pyrophosphatase MutT (NUDIX family)
VTTPFRKISERLLQQGAVVAFYETTFEGPDGQTFERDVVKHPGAVSVVALDTDGSVVMVRQFRAALERDVLEIVAGKRDVADEPLEITAARELEEEVGLVAGSYVKLAEVAHSPGFTDEINHVFLATDLSETQISHQGIEEENMTIERVPLEDVVGMISSGEITDAKSIVGLLLTRERLASSGS